MSETFDYIYRTRADTSGLRDVTSALEKFIAARERANRLGANTSINATTGTEGSQPGNRRATPPPVTTTPAGINKEIQQLGGAVMSGALQALEKARATGSSQLYAEAATGFKAIQGQLQAITRPTGSSLMDLQLKRAVDHVERLARGALANEKLVGKQAPRPSGYKQVGEWAADFRDLRDEARRYRADRVLANRGASGTIKAQDGLSRAQELISLARERNEAKRYANLSVAEIMAQLKAAARPAAIQERGDKVVQAQEARYQQADVRSGYAATQIFRRLAEQDTERRSTLAQRAQFGTLTQGRTSQEIADALGAVSNNSRLQAQMQAWRAGTWALEDERSGRAARDRGQADANQQQGRLDSVELRNQFDNLTRGMSQRAIAEMMAAPARQQGLLDQQRRVQDGKWALEDERDGTSRRARKADRSEREVERGNTKALAAEFERLTKGLTRSQVAETRGAASYNSRYDQMVRGWAADQRAVEDRQSGRAARRTSEGTAADNYASDRQRQREDARGNFSPEQFARIMGVRGENARDAAQRLEIERGRRALLNPANEQRNSTVANARALGQDEVQNRLNASIFREAQARARAGGRSVDQQIVNDEQTRSFVASNQAMRQAAVALQAGARAERDSRTGRLDWQIANDKAMESARSLMERQSEVRTGPRQGETQEQWAARRTLAESQSLRMNDLASLRNDQWAEIRKNSGAQAGAESRAAAYDNVAQARAVREDRAWQNVSGRAADNYARLGIMPMMSRADRATETRAAAEATFAQAVDRFLRGVEASRQASGAGSAAMRNGVANGRQEWMALEAQRQRLTSAEQKRFDTVSRGADVAGQAEAYRTVRAATAEARRNIADARSAALQDAPGLRGAMMRRGEEFRQGFRGNEEVPVLTQLGQTARFSTYYGGVYRGLDAIAQGMQVVTQEFFEFDDAMQNLALMTGASRGETAAFALDVAEMGAQVGLAADKAIQLAQQATQLYGLTDQGDLGGLDRSLVESTVESVGRISALSGKNANEGLIMQQMVGLQRSYGLGDFASGQVEDSMMFISKRTGKSMDDLMTASADVGTLANQGGFDMQTMTAAIAQIGTTLAQTPRDTSGALRQVLSKADDPVTAAKLQSMGVETAGRTLYEVFDQIATKYQTGEVSDSQLSQLTMMFGRGASQQNLQVMLKEWDRIKETATGAKNVEEGYGKDSFAVLMQSISKQLSLLGKAAGNLGLQIGQSGILAGLGAIVIGLRYLMQGVAALVGLWNELPEMGRNIGMVAIQLMILWKALGGRKIIFGTVAAMKSLWLVMRGVTAASAAARAGEMALAAARMRAAVTGNAALATSSVIAPAAGAGAAAGLAGAVALFLPALVAAAVTAAVAGFVSYNMKRRDDAIGAFTGAAESGRIDGSEDSMTSAASKWGEAAKRVEESQKGLASLLKLDSGLDARQNVAENMRDFLNDNSERQGRLRGEAYEAQTDPGETSFFGEFSGVDSVNKTLETLSNSGYSAADQVRFLTEEFTRLVEKMDGVKDAAIRFESPEEINATANMLSTRAVANQAANAQAKFEYDIAQGSALAQQGSKFGAGSIFAGAQDAFGMVGGALTAMTPWGEWRDLQAYDVTSDKYKNSSRAVDMQKQMAGWDPSTYNQKMERALKDKLTLANKDGSVTKDETAQISKEMEAIAAQYLDEEWHFKKFGEEAADTKKVIAEGVSKEISDGLESIRAYDVSLESALAALSGLKTAANNKKEETRIDTYGSDWAANRQYVDDLKGMDEAVQKLYDNKLALLDEALEAGVDNGGIDQEEYDKRKQALDAMKGGHERDKKAAELQKLQDERAKVQAQMNKTLSTMGVDDSVGRSDVQIKHLENKLTARAKMSEEDVLATETELNNLRASRTKEAREAANAMALATYHPGNTLGRTQEQLKQARATLGTLTKGSREYATTLEQINGLQLELAKYAVNLAGQMDALKVDPRDQVGQAQLMLRQAGRELGLARQSGDPLAIAQARQAQRDAAYRLTQEQLAVTNAQTEASYTSGDSVGQAASALTVARANLNAAMQGTAAWYQAWRSYQDALQSLGQAQREHAHNLRLLSIDMTDPVQEAAANVAKAVSDLAAADSAAERAAAQVALKQAQNQEEAAAFSQRLRDVQTAEELGRMSHSQYMAYLQSEHDRLNSIAGRTRQQQDQLDEVDKLMKAAAEQANGQWNLGEIDLPTAYEVRRSMAALGMDSKGRSATMGAASTSTTYASNITIYGADASQIIGYVEGATGGATGFSTATVRRG